MFKKSFSKVFEFLELKCILQKGPQIFFYKTKNV